MTCEFIHKTKGNQNLIVIFAGWSTDPSFYSHVIISGWDTLVVSDYSDFDFHSEILNGYRNIALFAWSLGVYAASRCFPFEKACISIAVNGTEHPVNDTLGIPEKIFLGTSATLSERNLMKFRRRMAGDSYAPIAESFPDIPIESLQAQLNFISGHYHKKLPPKFSRWNRVYISGNDLIFPHDAQQKAWAQHPSKPQIVRLDSPHYVDLLPIIRAAVPQHDVIGNRFRKALPTYNSAASPQDKIAENLVSLLTDNTDSIDNILEIGPGTGFLSRRFAEKFHPRHIDFIDLFKTGPFNIVQSENYIVADAEAWVANAAEAAPEKYDAIISASAIQWFINPAEFFRNAAAMLKPGGFLLCSTFLPGNLHQLQAVNPFGLVYHSSEELQKYLSEFFSEIVTKEEEITINFNTPRETLAHLIHTGVGGSAKSILPLSDLLRCLPISLSYRPLYILARKNLNFLGISGSLV